MNPATMSHLTSYLHCQLLGLLRSLPHDRTFHINFQGTPCELMSQWLCTKSITECLLDYAICESMELALIIRSCWSLDFVISSIFICIFLMASFFDCHVLSHDWSEIRLNADIQVRNFAIKINTRYNVSFVLYSKGYWKLSNPHLV